jgi:probable HAF family extracellular repeat protein
MRDINDRGQITGSGNTASGDVHAMLWDGGAIMDLGTLGGITSTANAINERGQIVGSSDTADANNMRSSGSVAK